ncbi:MAG: hypothetical protein MHM6MM_002044 [Cercozoa sp. M6MM]
MQFEEGYVIAREWSAISVGRDITSECVIELSSAKPGYGTRQLLSRDEKEYWQSCGEAPHCLEIRPAAGRTEVLALAFLCDYEQDESYTPLHVSIECGSDEESLELVHAHVQLDDPTGWVLFRLPDRIKLRMLRLTVHDLYLNGRDVHIRGVKVLAARSKQQQEEARLGHSCAVRAASRRRMMR